MKQYALALIAALGSAGNAQAIPLVLDSFSDPASPLPGQIVTDTLADGTAVTASLTGLTGVLGGSRDLSIDKTSGFDPIPANLISNRYGAGLLWLDNSAGVLSMAEVIWDGAGSGLGNLSGARGFLFDVFSVANTVTVSMLLEESGGSTSSLTRTFSPLDNSSTVLLPFGVAVDLTNISRITMTLAGSVGDADITLDTIFIVPEPVPLALLAGGLGLIGFRLRSAHRRT